MKQGLLYRHECNTDVAFSPRFIEETEDGIFCRGVWWNITCSFPFIIDKDEFNIKTEDLPKWRLHESDSRFK